MISCVKETGLKIMLRTHLLQLFLVYDLEIRLPRVSGRAARFEVCIFQNSMPI